MANVLYFVEIDYGRHGKAFEQCDRDINSRSYAIQQIREGNVIKVLEIDEEAGSARDVTSELTAEAEGCEWVMSSSTYDRLAWERDHQRDLRKHEVA